MINPGLNVHKSFKEQVEHFINAKFSKLPQYSIKTTLYKNKCVRINNVL